MPSESANANIAICKFIASFIECAVPVSPKYTVCSAIDSKSGLHFSKISFFPDAMITNFPFIATFGPPMTGISI